ncbi:hypothetical protein PO124_21700 [Bacillus licheniformis]|nr:hypothetical protein [Bacillus licheniformis]
MYSSVIARRNAQHSMISFSPKRGLKDEGKYSKEVMNMRCGSHPELVR